MATEKFAAYLTYVKKFDDHSLRLGTPPIVNPEPTAAELTARAIALAIHNRDDKYAKLALGIEAVPALTQHTNYRFYEEYKLVVEAMKKKALDGRHASVLREHVSILMSYCAWRRSGFGSTVYQEYYEKGLMVLKTE
ncbi:hypothetical protein PR003_g17527 [Phytophthora rubi]|uniref:Uncharacterized protein n=1 Tax=Phytophthora rubi TaxID=129364 RepID=A0A6A4E7J9_9STRA|nr:hypothetical protein PR001_g20206 [Phytophthora rubi]KAE9321207.1 hypothetical protein PR003_g17527 [Phytophthora rubi]